MSTWVQELQVGEKVARAVRCNYPRGMPGGSAMDGFMIDDGGEL